MNWREEGVRDQSVAEGRAEGRGREVEQAPEVGEAGRRESQRRGDKGKISVAKTTKRQQES
jgi:hypothetical protein